MRLRLTSLTRAVSPLLFRSSSPIGCPRLYSTLGRRVDRRRGYARHSKADTTVVQFAGSLGAAASRASLLGSSSPRWHALLLLPRAPPSRTRCLCPPCPRTHILPNTQSAAPLFVGCRCCPAPYNGKRSWGPLPACPGCRNKSHPASTTNNQRTQMARSSKSTKTPREPDASVYYCTEPWQRMVTRYAAKAQLHL